MSSEGSSNIHPRYSGPAGQPRRMRLSFCISFSLWRASDVHGVNPSGTGSPSLMNRCSWVWTVPASVCCRRLSDRSTSRPWKPHRMHLKGGSLPGLLKWTVLLGRVGIYSASLPLSTSAAAWVAAASTRLFSASRSRTSSGRREAEGRQFNWSAWRPHAPLSARARPRQHGV